MTDVETIAAQARAVAGPYAATTPTERAGGLLATAAALERSGGELIAIGMRETGLPAARLSGELKRTCVQLRLFADVVVDGSYLDVRIDQADPDFILGPRPDLRRCLVPLGPVLNFAASNFPFAFSVAGGDTAAALAAGCPVVVKAHPGHPELSRRTAEVVRSALVAAGLPADVLQLAEGQDEGVALLRDQRIKAGAFTGSLRAGRILADIAAARPAPIPFFGELGSVNPVFVTGAALAERGAEIAEGFAASVGGSAGQLCTKPGVVFLPAGHDWADRLRGALSGAAGQRLLNPSIATGYRQGQEAVTAQPGVRTLVPGRASTDENGQSVVTPSVAACSVATLREHRDILLDEVFGPFSLLVEYDASLDANGLGELAAEFFEGNLTATVHAGSGERGLESLVAILTEQAGRVLFGGWPTGVAVTPAMQHGGPWPATTNAGSTSVGTASIARFLRPVVYQNCPDPLLPPALRSGNPWGVPQRIAPAGESVHWGERAAG